MQSLNSIAIAFLIAIFSFVTFFTSAETKENKLLPKLALKEKYDDCSKTVASCESPYSNDIGDSQEATVLEQARIFTEMKFRKKSNKEISWAQKECERMSIDEKIGQLFWVAAYVDPDYANLEIGKPHIIEEMDQLIEQCHFGGLVFVGPSEIVKQVMLTNHYQEISKYPLFIAQDLEWGLAMRIKDAMCFPKNCTLEAIEDNRLIYEMGKEIGKQAKLIGVHVNLSPVLDVNIEQENIAINVRSFGNSPQNVAEKGIAMIQGLQDAGVIASAKHFPGLGDIQDDPHIGLPSNLHAIDRLRNVELYPFIHAINAGVLSIQNEHLIIPALEPRLKTPASLSSKIVNHLLKQELGFKGLILSGALRMKALANHFSEKEIIINAFLAGNDILLMPQNPQQACNLLKMAIAEGTISESQVDERVLKILHLKESMRLHTRKIVDVPTPEQLHPSSAQLLKKQLYQKAVSVIRDKYHLLPISQAKSIAYVQLGNTPSSHYFDILSQKYPMDIFNISSEEENKQKIETVLKQMENYSLIILGIYPTDPRRILQIRLLDEEKQKQELKHFRVHGISSSLQHTINAFHSFEKKIIVTFFGNPWGLHFLEHFSTMIMAFESDADAEYAASEVLMGHYNP